MCFADDLLLFTRGDHVSMVILMQQFHSFSASTGLIANNAKCKVYFGGVDLYTQQEILNKTGFGLGMLPFKYLGVPLDSKKLTIQRCLPLLEKIVVGFKHWSAKLLNYSGRLQLIKSVIFSMISIGFRFFQCQRRC